jgi:hypothetical protein
MIIEISKNNNNSFYLINMYVRTTIKKIEIE